ncbi:hypothetical protein YC2023_065441 [Brassica napus]
MSLHRKKKPHLLHLLVQVRVHNTPNASENSLDRHDRFVQNMKLIFKENICQRLFRRIYFLRKSSKDSLNQNERRFTGQNQFLLIKDRDWQYLWRGLTELAT